jgi:hypothetical protein
MTRRHLAGWLVLAVSAVVGCNPDAPRVSGSMEEAAVKGTVRVRGKAVDNGIVTFRPSNINRPNVPAREAPIGKDGTYSIKALIGQNFVDVSCKEILTPKNRDLIENERLVDIKSGDNALDLEIPPQPPPP